MKRLSTFLFAGLLLLGTAVLLTGCDQLLLFNPKGPIGAEECFVLIAATALMLLVIIPVVIMSVWYPGATKPPVAGTTSSISTGTHTI